MSEVLDTKLAVGIGNYQRKAEKALSSSLICPEGYSKLVHDRTDHHEAVLLKKFSFCLKLSFVARCSTYRKMEESVRNINVSRLICKTPSMRKIYSPCGLSNLCFSARTTIFFLRNLNLWNFIIIIFVRMLFGCKEGSILSNIYFLTAII